MSEISFSKEEKEIIVGKIQNYAKDELDQELGRFDAEFLLEFFSKEIGPYYYNRGLYDAYAIISDRLENISESIYAIEKPTEFVR